MFPLIAKDSDMEIPPKYVKSLRARTGETQAEAAQCVHVSLRTWQSWEAPTSSANHRQMPVGYLELYCLKHGLEFDSGQCQLTEIQ